MGEGRSFIRFLIVLIAPFVLVVGGAGIAGLGLANGWSVLIWGGLIVCAIGLLWGLIVLLVDSPLDWFG